MNIIFDLGGVVFNWNPQELINDVFSDESLRVKISKDLYEHSDWLDMDRGTLSFEDVAERASERTGAPASSIMYLLNKVADVLTLKPDTLQFIEELHKKNYKLYVLSNMSGEVADQLEKKYSFWNLFDGIVFSARIKLIKPSNEIYKYILNKYGLCPYDTVFFDDMQVNVEGAAKAGINAIQFKSAKQAKDELEKLLKDNIKGQ